MKAIAEKPQRLPGKAVGELGKRLISSCLASGSDDDARKLLSDQSGALPFVFALTEEGRPIQLVYQCADLCPDYGRVGIYFYDLTERECCELGQIPDHDWDGYSGCVPREIAAPSAEKPNRCDRLDRSGPDPGRHQTR